MKFCKYLLGIPSTSSNVAVRSELGRNPMLLSILDSIMRYYGRLEGMSDDRLVKEVYNLTNNQKFSLQKLSMYISDSYGLDAHLIDFTEHNAVKRFSAQVKSQLRFWFFF